MIQTTKSQRRKIKRAINERDFIYLFKSALFHLRLSSIFWFKRFGYKMYVFHTPFAFWLWTEGRERSDENFYKRFLKQGDTVVDAGANIGLCTLLSGMLVGEFGKVISFEPAKTTFTQLSKNINLNRLKNTTPINKGVGDKIEIVNFTKEYVSDINHVDPIGKAEVSITTLDNELKNLDHIDLLKIDVEGYELFALAGARETLCKTKLVYFENNPKTFDRFGYGFVDIFKLLNKFGFSIYKETGAGLKKLEYDYTCLCNYENLLAFSDTNKEFVLSRLNLDIEK